MFGRAVKALRFSETGERVYFANHAVLSAADFGVPQDRRRLFVIGVRRDKSPKWSASTVTTTSLRCSLSRPHLAIRRPIGARRVCSRPRADVAPWRRSMMTSALDRIVRQLPRAPRKVMHPSHVGLRRDRQFTLSRCAWTCPRRH